jgi:hypothetical protein
VIEPLKTACCVSCSTSSDGYVASTKRLISAGFDGGWMHMRAEIRGKAMILHVWKLLQSLEQRRLVKHKPNTKIGRRVWELTDDGRHEARKLKPMPAPEFAEYDP